MSKKNAPPPLRSDPLPFAFQNRIVMAFLATVMAALFLSACAAEPTPAAEPTDQPTVAPTPTAIPYEDFAGAAVPTADPVQLAQLTRLLSLVPQSFSSAIYLDMEHLRSNVGLAAAINPEGLGLDLVLPPLVTGLVNTIAVAGDFQNRTVITPFRGDFDIGELLRLAGGLGLDLNTGGSQPYEGHDVWDIDALGTLLAMAEADETTGVAASGRDATASDARALAEASLDAFDGRSARLLDRPGLAELAANVPSGFAAVVLSQCETLPLFAYGQWAPGCTGAVATAGMLSSDLVVFHSLIAFPNQNLAAVALKRATEVVDGQKQSHGFKDLGVRQEGENLRVRVIVNLLKFTDAFRLFAPGQ